MKNLIQKIAKGCRDEMQRLAPWINTNGVRNNNIQKHLSGYCGYGSVLVWQKLKAAGRAPQLVNGHGHWFTICDGLLVDVTASQFGQSKVVVRDYEKVKEMIDSGEYRMSWWQEQRVTDDPCGMGLCANVKQLKEAAVYAKTHAKDTDPKNCGTCGEVPGNLTLTE